MDDEVFVFRGGKAAEFLEWVKGESLEEGSDEEEENLGVETLEEFEDESGQVWIKKIPTPPAPPAPPVKKAPVKKAPPAPPAPSAPKPGWADKMFGK